MTGKITFKTLRKRAFLKHNNYVLRYLPFILKFKEFAVVAYLNQ